MKQSSRWGYDGYWRGDSLVDDSIEAMGLVSVQ